MIEVRLFEDRDFEGLCRLCHGVSEYYRPREVLDFSQTEEYVRDHVLGDDSDVRVVMALVDNRAAGMATFSIMYPSASLKGQLYMKELYVDEDFRGKGAGRALMKFVARYAVKHNCSRLDWSAEKTNPAALDFYRAIGATPVEEKVYFRIAGVQLKSFSEKE